MSAPSLPALLLASLLQVGTGVPAPASTEPPAATASPGAADEDPREQARAAELNRAGTQLQQGQPQAALETLDALLADYGRQYQQEARRLYCARTPGEALLYLLQSAKASETAIVLDQPTLAYAHHLRAYTLAELKRPLEAAQATDQALALSPSNPVFLAEHGYQQQLAGDWEGMLQTYLLAEEMVNVATPEDSQASERGRALRGRGYALVELQRLDEAEQVYLEALALDAGDSSAAAELEYVRQQRAAGAP